MVSQLIEETIEFPTEHEYVDFTLGGFSIEKSDRDDLFKEVFLHGFGPGVGFSIGIEALW